MHLVCVFGFYVLDGVLHMYWRLFVKLTWESSPNLDYLLLSKKISRFYEEKEDEGMKNKKIWIFDEEEKMKMKS